MGILSSLSYIRLLQISHKFHRKLIESSKNILIPLKMSTNPNTETPAEKRNIEIKANLGNDDEFKRRIDIAKKLTNTDGEIIEQHDIFYQVSNGRLKLRYLKDLPAQLVQYSRNDTEGPKLSQFNLYSIEQPDLLNRMLATSLGVKGEVKKTRHLYMYGQTRIHLDQVKELGNYLEFEVCLQPEQTIEYGTDIANKLIAIFEIKSNQLITGAYMDELLK